MYDFTTDQKIKELAMKELEILHPKGEQSLTGKDYLHATCHSVMKLQ
jgi:hypothetical protein